MDSHVDDELRRQLLAYEQRYDIQTGLLNQQSFLEALSGLLRSRPASGEVALIWIDILNLRRVFTVYGSAGAEGLVNHIAASLRSSAESSALMGHFSSESFVVVLEVSKSDRAGQQRVQSLVDSLAPQRAPGDLRAAPEVAAGVAFWPSDTESAEDLVRFASLAAGRTAHIKSNSVLAFQAGMNQDIMHDHQLEIEMGKALDEGLFRVFYQPKISLTTGEVLGAEALIRWDHPRWGTITPAEFIPIAEQSDLIDRIMDYTLRSALMDAQRWRDKGLALPVITVNASAANLRRGDFARSVRTILAEIPIAPTSLELEVTESMLFDDEALFAKRVRQLKAVGVKIAIDDFGTRYTGFNVLKELALDAMKIDRCFIHGIDRSPDMRALCETIVAMAKQLKLRTVAEGVEELGELEVLKEIGCDAVQGFLLQHPVPAEELTPLLMRWPSRLEKLGFGVSPLRLLANPV